jgi:hypothetical protein
MRIQTGIVTIPNVREKWDAQNLGQSLRFQVLRINADVFETPGQPGKHFCGLCEAGGCVRRLPVLRPL